ncbi:hypothetical protein HK102_000495 [Quaeritorhiza haematococci]|nr:hypothetical protein HK102_000495 [Quaeritorhiza haematococci]
MHSTFLPLLLLALAATPNVKAQRQPTGQSNTVPVDTHLRRIRNINGAQQLRDFVSAWDLNKDGTLARNELQEMERANRIGLPGNVMTDHSLTAVTGQARSLLSNPPQTCNDCTPDFNLGSVVAFAEGSCSALSNDQEVKLRAHLVCATGNSARNTIVVARRSGLFTGSDEFQSLKKRQIEAATVLLVSFLLARIFVSEPKLPTPEIIRVGANAGGGGGGGGGGPTTTTTDGNGCPDFPLRRRALGDLWEIHLQNNPALIKRASVNVQAICNTITFSAAKLSFFLDTCAKPTNSKRFLGGIPMKDNVAKIASMLASLGCGTANLFEYAISDGSRLIYSLVNGVKTFCGVIFHIGNDKGFTAAELR